MIERQSELGDNYKAITEETSFTPDCPILDQKTRIAYTLPFQELVLPFLDSSGVEVEERPPLMHMAAIIGDIPLLKRAVDVENRGELWNFRVVLESSL